MTRAQISLVAAVGSTLLLAAAFGFQAMGYAPCKLCLWQRWPHGLAMVLGGWALLAVMGRAPLPRIAVWLGASAAATSAVLGGYHTGVEQGWWPGPDSCTGQPIAGLSPADLLTQIMAAPIIRCDDIAWSLLGLSMASWNMLASGGLAVVWLLATRRT